jgi:hypothetical protein
MKRPTKGIAMRHVLNAASLTLVVAGLGACGQSDEAFRATYRTGAVESCVTGARSAPNAAVAAAQIDFQRLCGCTVDAYMAQATTEQLRREGSGSTPPPAARAAMMTCLGQLRPGLGGTTPAATPTGDKPS